MAEADSSNKITRKYIYGKGLLAMATSSARYCYHFNGTGSTVALTDMTQAVVNSYAYDPFGTILNQQETVRPALQVRRPIWGHGRAERPLLHAGKVL